MQRTSFSDMRCPVARSLERVGEWWSILILRDAFLGITRFDDLQASLGIAPNMLTRRLRALVEAGMLERRRYSDKPPRYEYVLTPRGRDFRPVLVALMAWGNRQFAVEGEAMQLIDEITGEVVEPVMVDAKTGVPIDRSRHTLHAGPAADERTRARVETYAQHRALQRAASDTSSP
ncbi:transcriptional regulator [Dyella monticola]|uniref:Transcriptional regulator n=1 Tax=Dyella monticola TaxID=1927958 RepID=A0A370X515_9GAMM|nr:helix-turn-helix domain-containing protein [Dyella monticola]RDS83514.1 transcriptional regulator [Dyella monticola]